MILSLQGTARLAVTSHVKGSSTCREAGAVESLAGLLATEASGSLASQTGGAGTQAPLQDNCPGLVACLQMLHVLLQGSGAAAADLMLRQAAAAKCITWCLKGNQGPAVSTCRDPCTRCQDAAVMLLCWPCELPGATKAARDNGKHALTQACTICCTSWGLD